MLVNRRAINASPFLKALVLGLSEEEVKEKTREAKRRRGDTGPKAPETQAEITAYVWQHIARAAVLDQMRGALVLKPQVYMSHALADAVVRRAVPWAALLQGPLSSLNAQFNAITHYGIGSAADAEDLQWSELQARAPVPMVRRRGQRGGHPSCPAVQFKSRDSVEFTAFLQHARAVFELATAP